MNNKMKAVIEKNAEFSLKHYPISIWNYTDLKSHGEHMDENEMQALYDAGITLPQSPNFDPTNPAEIAHIRNMLDWADKRDMKLTLRDPRCMVQADKHGNVPDDYADGVRAAVADFGAHPALFGFFVGDEGGGDAAAECQRIQKEIAPHLFPFYNHLPVLSPDWDRYLDKYMRLSNSDILGYDCYMQMHFTEGQSGIDIYYNNLRVYREASLRHGVPFWNTPLSLGHMMYRTTSRTDLVWQLNTSVAAGAHGIVWFFWYLPSPGNDIGIPPVDEFWEQTQVYKDMRHVQNRFHKTYGVLFNGLVSTRVSFFPTAAPNDDVWAPNDLVLAIWPAYDNDLPVLVGEFTDIDGRPYVMIVNNSQTQADRILVKFPLNAKIYSYRYGSVGEAYLIAEVESPDEDCIPVWLWLGPGEGQVFRVELAN